MKKKLLILSTIIGLVVFGGVMLWPQKVEEPIAKEADDTGMTRHQTEELMRKIGYVQ